MSARRAGPPPGFAMVPAWLAWRRPSGNACIVYIHLALFGKWNPAESTYDECRPSKKTLALGNPRTGYPGTGLGTQSVARALRELESLGAIRGEPSYHPVTGAQGPTVYQLQFLPGDQPPTQTYADKEADQEPVDNPQFGRLGHAGSEAPDLGITSDTGGYPLVVDGKIPAQPPASNSILQGGITGDMGPVSPRYPRAGITCDTQPIGIDPEPVTQTPPWPRDGDSRDESPSAQSGGGLDSGRKKISEDAVLVLDEVFSDMPKARRPGGKSLADLRSAVEAQLRAGWGVKQLTLALSGSFRGAGTVAGALRYRLSGLGDPVADVPPLRPVDQERSCEYQCDATGVVDVGEVTLHCPSCRPGAHAKQLLAAGERRGRQLRSFEELAEVVLSGA
jgi:hypothetical protein